ncbi:MAG: EF-hand domain-containing protein [Chloroflexota bacterium]
MLDGIRKRKVTLLFIMLDTDQNGYVERPDFERAAKSLATLNGVSQFSEEYLKLRKTFMDIYEHIKTLMDTDGNHRIQLDEWVKYFGQMLNNDDRYVDIIAPIARDIFNMLDQDENGKISIKEWQLFAGAYQIPEDEVGDLFARLDSNSSGYITREEFGHMMTDFFFSEDPDAPGNYIFGNY